MCIGKRFLAFFLVVALVTLAAAWASAQSDALMQLQSTVESLYARLAPSVVNITNTAVTTNQFMQPVPEQGPVPGSSTTGPG